MAYSGCLIFMFLGMQELEFLIVLVAQQEVI